jgi:serine phosphatase RsbU (regulator of sigma subunit)
VSIASRLRWSYLISSTLPLLLVGGLLIYISMNAQQGSVYNDQKAQATRLSRDVARYIDGILDQVGRYALLVRPATSPERMISAAQDEQTRSFPDLIDLAVLNSDGKERLRVHNLQAIAANKLRDLSGDPSVQAALRSNKSTYSAITLNPDGIHSFIATLPLPNDSGTIVGVLRAEISAAPIMQELALVPGNSNSYAYLITTSTGTVLLDDGAPGFAAPQELSRLLTTPSGTAEYAGARDQDVIGAMVPVSVGPRSERTGWSVVVEQPASIAFSTVRSSVIVLTALLILVGLLALLWAFRQAQDFLRPLSALRAGASALGAGHLEHRIAPLGNDELADLAQTFNTMAAHLQESLAQIEHQNERLRHGLALARDIQVGLLPNQAPWSNDTIAVYARSIPAYEVGGDFYTYLALPGGRAAIAIGDISGKGVGAALLMALTSSAVETQGRQLEHPAQVLIALDRLLAPRLKANHMNAALLFAVLDPHTGTLRVANAGMIAPVLVTPQGSYFIDANGLPLGSFPGATYQEVSIKLNPGDSLLLLSDGVVEAHNARSELFGFERLEATVAEAALIGDVRALVELVIERVQSFAGDTEQHDDITMVAVRPAIMVEESSLAQEQTIGYASV